MRAVVLSIALVVFSTGCKNAELEAQIKKLSEEKTQLDKQVSSLRAENAQLDRRVKKAVRDQEAAEEALAKERAKEVRAALGLKADQKLFATFKTSMGDIVAELYVDQAPKTVENFVRLAEGTKEWTDPKSKEVVKRPLYPGTVFHRVIPGFMVQGGDPLGTGTGNPGYRFEDEFVTSLRHDRAGRLSMANSGPNTNGSQFFITEKPTSHLDNRHTIFGQVIDNLELIKKMANVPKAPGQASLPAEPILLKTVLIGRGGPKK